MNNAEKHLNRILGFTSRPKIERDYRVKGKGKQYDKLKEKLAAFGLELATSYNKWYNVFDKEGMNVRYDVFDTLADIEYWLKNDYEDWKINGR